MLEEIVIKGWQRHKSLSIRFDPRITTIVGPSESGKSAIVRALKWIILNQWTGESVDINHDSTVAKIKLKVDGKTLIRKRSVSNLYRLDDAKFKAFGKSVPEAIGQLLRMSELNFQDQFDPHFWLSLPPGQVSKELNSIIDLDIIDRAISLSNKELRQAKAELDVSKKRFKKLKQDKQDLAWVPEAADKIKKLNDIEERLQKSRGKAAALDILCHTIIEVTEIKEGLEKTLRQGEKLQAIHEKLAKTERLEILIRKMKKNQRLKNLPIPKYDDTLQSRITSLHLLIGKIRNLEWLSRQKCPVCGKTL